MRSSYVITIINRFSLFFCIFNIVFAAMGYENVNGLMFAWSCLITFALFNVKRYKAKLVLYLIPAAYLPLFISTSINEFIFKVITITFALFMTFKGLELNEYEEELTTFKKGLGVCLALLIICLITMSMREFSSYSAQYIVIYMVSSIVLLRTLRFVKYNKDSREAMSINTRYSIAIAGLSFLFCISYVRDAIVKGLSFIYNLIIDGFMFLFSWFFNGIGYALEGLMALIWKLMALLKLNPLEQSQGLFSKSKQPAKKLQEIDKESLAELLAKNKLFATILKVAIVLLVVYIIIRIFRSFFAAKKKDEDCVESVEFIKRDKISLKSIVGDLAMKLKGKEVADSIRIYYKKFMHLCRENDIIIQKSDTTMDINNKSHRVFNDKILNDFRNVYIKVRYGNKAYDKSTGKQFIKQYQMMKKESDRNQERL